MSAPLEAEDVEVLDRPLHRASLLEAVRAMSDEAAAVDLPLEIDGVVAARASLRRLVDQLHDHIVPRLTQLSTPVVVVVAGSTGAGKSTLVNSVVGAEVTRAGVLRPTTRQPVLVHHPLDAELLVGHPLLGIVDDVANDAVPRGLALLDAPDVDSLLAENRSIAHRMLEAADLWLFVTTAARYGDAVPWQVLGEAIERGASVAVVLNRVNKEALAPVRADLLQRLRERGLAQSPLFVVADAGAASGLLPPRAVAPITRWLGMLAGADRARSVIARTLRGSFESLRPWVAEVADAQDAQAHAAEVMRAELTTIAADVSAAVQEEILHGGLLNAVIAARWAGLVGRGGALRSLVKDGTTRGSSRAQRDRSAAVVPLGQSVTDAVAHAIVAAVGRVTAAVADRTPAPPGWTALALDGAGAGVVAGAPSLAQQWWDELVADMPAAVLRAGRPARAVGEAAAAALVGLAALGHAEAGRVAAGLGLAAATDHARAAISSLGADAVAAVVAEVAAPLAVPSLAPDAAAGLRIRNAQMRSMT